MSREGERRRRVVITAGASGIGREVALRFALVGADVTICDVNDHHIARLAESAPSIRAVKCDVTDAAAVEDLVAYAAQAMGGLDTVIANAGTAGPTAFAEDVSPEDWEATIAVNLSGQFYLIRSSIPFLKKEGNGSIVTISSAAGRLGFPMRAPYAAAKWGVIGLTQTLAMELGEFGIRVNTILPGSVEGDRMQSVLKERAVHSGISYEMAREQEIENVSMKRLIEPNEIADLIFFITSEKGRSISGQSIGICGNLEVLR
ncbi:MAG: SDR family oxidoreductase [Gammaproteobacteria bacterium]|nr:SDR family oxidoreductase [Gammaproteobacteria bacterium]